MIYDTNTILRSYLITQTPLTNIVGNRIYCPRLPEKAILPAIGYFVRGGTSTPYIPDLLNPSYQFDCWAKDMKAAREVYYKLYEALQGIQNQEVVIGGAKYYIVSAEEEVQGQDLVENEIPGYYRVLTYYRIQF